MSYNSRFDWSGFFVHFVFGAVVGAAFGFGPWVRSPEATSSSSTPGYIYIGGAGLICGIVAGLIGDRFWHSISDWFRWW